MEIPESLRKLMQKDHNTRVFISQLIKKDKLLEDENKELHKEIDELKKRMENLEERNNKLENQFNELKSYIWKPNNKKEPGKLGPPKGHKANHRPKPKHVDETIDMTMNYCPDCNSPLSRTVEVKERYIEDIQPSKPHVKKYLIHRYYCKSCKRIVSDKPNEIPRCRFGLNLLILIVFLRYGVITPINKITKQLSICYGLNVSEGTIHNELTRFANYLGPEFERIKKEVRELAAVNVDETSWRINGKNKWLWGFIGEKHSLLLIRNTRRKSVLKEVIGEYYDGILTTDCLAVYDGAEYKQQKCWAHLLRETKKMKSKEGKYLHNCLKELNRLAKTGEFSKEDMIYMLDSVLNKGFTNPWCLSIIKRRIKKFKYEWFTFMDHDGVQDTNNAAERALRPSVVMRKITGGSRSYKGARNHEVIMSVMSTWDKQGIDFMEESMKYIKRQLH